MRAYIDCWNPISAHPGDNVVIEYRKVDEKKAKWFQILLPILCLAAGGIFGHALAGFFKMEFWFWPYVYYVERRRHPGRVPSLTIPSNANIVSVRSEEVGGGMPPVATPKR